MAKFLLGVWNGVVIGLVGTLYLETYVYGKDPKRGYDFIDLCAKNYKEDHNDRPLTIVEDSEDE